MRFDARAAKLLTAGGHIIVDGCPGLRLEASAARKTWTYRYRSPATDRMRQVAMGQWPAMSLTAAVAEWERLRQVREAGGEPADERKAARASVRRKAAGPYTVQRLVDDYMAGHVQHRRKASSYLEMQRVFRRLIGPIAALPAVEVTRTRAFEYLEVLADTPVQARLIRQELAGAWDYALDAGRLPDQTPNWWRLVMRGRLKTKGKTRGGERSVAKRILRDAEVGALLRWLPHFSETVADLLTLYLWTGTRGGELVQMEARELSEEPDGWWWTCPKAKTKNARHAGATDLRVPLVGRAAELVRRRAELARAEGRSHLFPPSRPVKLPHRTQASLHTSVHYLQPYSKARPEHVRERLPVTHWAPHDLRRTVRTMLAALGCPPDVAEAILGHMQPGIQGVYNLHHYDGQRREWITRLDAHLRACEGAAPAGA